MQTLYKRFVLLGLFFVFATVTLHWVVWTRSDGPPWAKSSPLEQVGDPAGRLSPPLPDENRVGGRGKEQLPVNIALGTGADGRVAGGVEVEKRLLERRPTDGPPLPHAQQNDLKFQSDHNNGGEKSKHSDSKVSHFIYNTESGYDRIPEQMKFVPPAELLPEKKGGRLIAVESGPESWNVRSGSKTFHEHQCPVKSCNLVDIHAIPSGAKVDAVLFRQEVAVDIQSLSRHRTPDSVYIVFALESPMATRSYKGLEGVFNWTATYRRQSTMVAPYERWQTFPNITALPVNASRNYAKGKSLGAAMFVSNCGASNGRLEVARELAKFYPVDIYGACGDKHCSRFDKKCFNMLTSDYRFYLAFENANCRDYITEKFFVNGLGNDVIPIVMGAHPDDYRKSSPPHSFIHVEDFPDVRSLGAYLKKLEENDDLYNEYFRWKGTGTFIDTKFWCRLCAMVSDPMKPRLVVKDFEEWWRGEPICRTTRWLS